MKEKTRSISLKKSAARLIIGVGLTLAGTVGMILQPHETPYLSAYQVYAAEQWNSSGEDLETYSAVFDANYYAEHNQDVTAVFGDEPQDLLSHFIHFGMQEGRQGCALFDVSFYRNTNGDLNDTFGDDLKSYYIHYINFGKAEGRSCNALSEISEDSYSAVYNKEYYLAHNGDVAATYGDDAKAIFTHFINFGMKEGRQASEEFNLQNYIENYSDVVVAFRDDKSAYYRHYIEFGKSEGRNGKTSEVDYSKVFDSAYYAKNNRDVVAAFGEDGIDLLQHFINFGMKEGRQGNEIFNVLYYRADYPDLQQAFGENLPSYYYHFINFGSDEGRIISCELYEVEKAAIEKFRTKYTNNLDYYFVKEDYSNLLKYCNDWTVGVDTPQFWGFQSGFSYNNQNLIQYLTCRTSFCLSCASNNLNEIISTIEKFYYENKFVPLPQNIEDNDFMFIKVIYNKESGLTNVYFANGGLSIKLDDGCTYVAATAQEIEKYLGVAK